MYPGVYSSHGYGTQSPAPNGSYNRPQPYPYGQGGRSWTRPAFPDGNATADFPLNSTTMVHGGVPLLDLTGSDSEAPGEACRICSVLCPEAASHLYSGRELTAHAAGHAAPALPQPLPVCFPASARSKWQLDTSISSTVTKAPSASGRTFKRPAPSFVAPPPKKPSLPPVDPTPLSFSLDQSAFGNSTSMVARGEAPPPPKQLLLWTHVLRKAWRLGHYFIQRCGVEGCSLTFAKDKTPDPASHMPKHAKKPTEECATCGYRSRCDLGNHFRMAHGVSRCKTIDIRSLNEAHFLDIFHACYPGLQKASVVYKALPSVTGDGSLPQKFIAQLDKLSFCGRLRCAFPDCASSELPPSATSLAIEQHILSHQTEPVFACHSCRYEGQDIFSHNALVHIRRGFSAAVFKFDDRRVDAEEELLRLADVCFPGAVDVDASEEEDAQKVQVALGAQPTRNNRTGSRRASPEDEKKPFNFLWLTRLLFGWRADTGGQLSCALCAYVVADGARADTHQLRHCRALIYRCRLCGLKNKHRARHGEDEAHKGSSPWEYMEDLRFEHESELIAATHNSFPILDALELWFPDSSQLSFGKQIAELSTSSETQLRCRIPMCDFRVGKTQSTGKFPEIAIHTHLLSHYEGEPLFRCHSCRFEGSDIYDHIKATHNTWARGRNALPFDDERGRAERRLLQLLNECF